MKKRGQSAFETFSLLVLVIGAVMPLLFYAADKAGTSFRLDQAEESMHDTAITANAISSLGKGNLNVVTISVPNGIKESYSEGNDLVYVFDDGTEVRNTLGQEVIGQLPKDSGFQNVRILALGDGKVKIGNGPYIYTLGPSCLVYPILNMTDRAAIIGTDFAPGLILYVNGAPATSGYGYVTPELVQFIYGGPKDKYPGLTNGTPYYFQIKNPDGQFSNTVGSALFLQGCNP